MTDIAETETTAQEVQPHVTLHWLNRSRAQRMVWLLEECKGCSYDIKVYKRNKDQLAPEELKKVHPLGKSPVFTITSADRPAGLTLAESVFEAEYLCDHFAPHLVPQRWQPGKENRVGGETEEWLRYRYYMHYNEGTMMPMLVISFIVQTIRTAPQPFFVRPITKGISQRIMQSFIEPNFRANFGFLEEQLKTSPNGGEYLCGPQLTAADILMSFPVLAGRQVIDAEKYPRIHAYAAKLEQSETYIRAVRKIEEVTGEKYTIG